MERVVVNKFDRVLGRRKFAVENKNTLTKRRIILMFAGLFIGFVNGLFGAGGGMLAVPLLTFVAGLNLKRSHASAILVILPICAVSATVYLVKGVQTQGALTPTVIGVVAGGLFGAYALKKCSNAFLQTLFYGVMLLAGIKMIF